jgi:hypothetical protein
MREALKRLVWERAGNRCEYCHFPAAQATFGFEIDHIIARKHQGASSEDNLALSCVYCNLAKGSDIASVDPASGELIRLFHPRSDVWSEHFQWNGTLLLGKTAIGRTTIRLLEINQPDLLWLRGVLSIEGSFDFQ